MMPPAVQVSPQIAHFYQADTFADHRYIKHGRIRGTSILLLCAGKGFPFFKGKALDRLEDCFRAFTEEERLEGYEAFFCSTCQSHCPATKALRLHRLPSCLILHIKRFKVQARSRVKLSANIAFPLQGLNLQPFCSDSSLQNARSSAPGSSSAGAGVRGVCGGSSTLYDLYAVVNHLGSIDSGHYTAFCRLIGGEGEPVWHHFADDKVSEVWLSSVSIFIAISSNMKIALQILFLCAL
jgi:hypothetical protein